MPNKYSRTLKEVAYMKTVRISLNSIDKVKSFVNDLTKFDVDFDLVSGRYVIDAEIHHGNLQPGFIQAD